MIKLTYLFITILSLLILSCTSSNETTNVLINDIWALESIDGVTYSGDENLKQHPIIEIHLKDEKLIGNTGCNNMNGVVKVDGNEISFSDIATTKMFCPESLEQKFLIALGKVNNYKIEKMRLYLFEDDIEKLVFRKID